MAVQPGFSLAEAAASIRMEAMASSSLALVFALATWRITVFPRPRVSQDLRDKDALGPLEALGKCQLHCTRQSWATR